MKKCRSNKKPPYVEANLLERFQKMQDKGDKLPMKVYRRSSTIIPKFVGSNFLVHNGKTFVQIYINESMIGHKFGEFVFTRIFKGHSGVKAKKQDVKTKKQDGGKK